MARARSAIRLTRDALRAQLWPLPVLGVLLAVGAGIGLPRLDERYDTRLPAWTADYLFGGDGDAARTVLDAVASSLITVTSLTFSLTVVTLQLASSQFSPRLLRTFTRDLFVQGTLGLFLATFTYALTVLRTVRTSADGKAQFVPRLSVTLGFALALVSVVGLVLFLAHLAREIRVETMLRTVHTQASATAVRVLPMVGAGARAAVPTVPTEAVVIGTPRSGFLVDVDDDRLRELARELHLTVRLGVYPGESLIAGTPMAWAWPHRNGRIEDASALVERIRDCVSIGYERTSARDVGYGLRQLTDVAVKALSPGINDPTTAVHALGHLSALLCEMATRDLGTRVGTDDDGSVLVVLPHPDLGDLLELAIEQPRRYGAADPLVVNRIYALLRELAWSLPPAQRDAVVSPQLARLGATVAAQDFDDVERSRLGAAADRVAAAVRGEWPASS